VERMRVTTCISIRTIYASKISVVIVVGADLICVTEINTHRQVIAATSTTWWCPVPALQFLHLKTHRISEVTRRQWHQVFRINKFLEFLQKEKTNCKKMNSSANKSFRCTAI
jgi:hypothetical protein